jgi:hypothetical protein
MNASTYPRSTPWGKPDRVKVYAPGIVLYSCPGHGGFWLSADRVAAMPANLGAVKTYAGPGWYEEDEDSRLVIASFPDLFEPYSCEAVARTLANHGRSWDFATNAPAADWVPLVDWPAYAASPQGRELLAIAASYLAENAGAYTAGSCGAGDGGEFCILEPIGGGPRLIATGKGAFRLGGIIRPESLQGFKVAPWHSGAQFASIY